MGSDADAGMVSVNRGDLRIVLANAGTTAKEGNVVARLRAVLDAPSEPTEYEQIGIPAQALDTAPIVAENQPLGTCAALTHSQPHRETADWCIGWRPSPRVPSCPVDLQPCNRPKCNDGCGYIGSWAERPVEDVAPQPPPSPERPTDTPPAAHLPSERSSTPPWRTDPLPDARLASELEAFMAGALSTMPPFNAYHPHEALPFARRALEALENWTPNDG